VKPALLLVPEKLQIGGWNEISRMSSFNLILGKSLQNSILTKIFKKISALCDNVRTEEPETPQETEPGLFLSNFPPIGCSPEKGIRHPDFARVCHCQVFYPAWWRNSS
jgi:hypothetical protein